MINRGRPTDFASRRQRALRLADSEPAMGDPLRFAAAIFSYQHSRLSDSRVERNAIDLASSAVDGHRLSLAEAVDNITQELVNARVALALTAPRDLALAWEDLGSAHVSAWVAAGEQLTAAQRLCIQAAAGPIVEGAAARIHMPAREAWSEPTCPVCGDSPRVSVIVEESGEFMRGSPRYLVCGRCASWWAFSRAVCPRCREQHPDRLALYTNDRWPSARIDSCLSCRSFIKTFDLRQPGAVGVVPLVDDLATVTLDFWALEQGLTEISRDDFRLRSKDAAVGTSS